MTLRVAQKTAGMRTARRVFKQLAAFGADPAELQDAIGQTLVESAVNRLAVTNKSPDGTAWPVSRRAKFGGGPTQYKTGAAGLAGSLTYRTLPGAVETGSALVYAAQRQFGGTITAKPGKALVFDSLDDAGNPIKVFAKSITQPARPYLGLSDDDADEIGALALAMLEDIVSAGAGGEGAP